MTDITLMRLIDADKLYEELKNHARNAKDMSMASVYNGIAIACGELNQAPTIAAEPIRHGHWEDVHIYRTTEKSNHGLKECLSIEAMCSVCNIYSRCIRESFDCDIAYCPVCGAKMDEEVTE